MTPVDPLNDAAWSRVERNVWTALDAMPDAAPPPEPARRPWLWLALPIAVAAVLVVYVVTRTPEAPVYARVISQAAPSTIALADARITLDPYSAVVTEPDYTLVESGSAWFDVEPRNGRAPFVVVAGDVRVRVIGTHFRVARSAEFVEVTVDRGMVEIGYHGDTTQVGRGGHWSTRPETAQAQITTQAPVAPAVDPAPVAPPVATPIKPPGADQDARRFAELTKLEAGDPDRAMTGYLELSKKSGTWAGVALFAAARLAVDRHDPRASSLLQIYLRRFPRGANVVDAQELLTRLQGASK